MQLRTKTWIVGMVLAGILMAPRCSATVDHGVTAELQPNLRIGEGAEGTSGLDLYETELRLRTDFNRRSYFWGAAKLAHEDGAHTTQLDESYLALTDRDSEIRLGRFRVPFGIIDRSEVEYSGFIDVPLVKDETIHGFQLGRVDSGLMALGGVPRLRYEVAFLRRLHDNDASRGACVRLQTFTNNFILGANIYNGTVRDPMAPAPSGLEVRADGLDWRYALPNLIVRGEAILQNVGGQRSFGWHVDALYHLPRSEDTTLLARYEQFTPDRNTSDPGASRWTVGLRYFIRPEITISLNYNRERRLAAPFNQRFQMQISKTFALSTYP